MKTNAILRFHGLILALVLLMATRASGGIITQEISVSGTLANPVGLTIEKFDPGLGTLTEVQFAFDVFGVTQLRAINPDPLQLRSEFFTVSSSIAFGPYLQGLLHGRGVAAFLSVPTEPGRFSAEGIGFAFVVGKGTASFSNPLMLHLFHAWPGVDRELNLPVAISGLQSPTLQFDQVASDLRGQLSVTYRFDESLPNQGPPLSMAVPEPSSLAIFGLGAFSLARFRRKKGSRGN